VVDLKRCQMPSTLPAMREQTMKPAFLMVIACAHLA
jgi:hypothetical protein